MRQSEPGPHPTRGTGRRSSSPITSTTSIRC